MSSRQRKKRNQRANMIRATSPYGKTIQALIKEKGLQVTGCSYGVHTWKFQDRGEVWFKICVAMHPDGKVCGATYHMLPAEIEYVKQAWPHLVETGVCPRCGGQVDTITRLIGQPTVYGPCGHKDLSADLKVGGSGEDSS